MNPERFYMVSPPMYRTTPQWYSDGLSEVMLRFSAQMSKDKPANLMLLPSFPSPSLETDGVHLTPFSGLEYILFLFDSSTEMLEKSKLSSGALIACNSEAIRSLEDRVVVLEQDRTRMSKNADEKSAYDAEHRDFLENQHHEDQFIISGLAKPSSGLSTQEWQVKVKQDVGSVISILLGRDAPIRVVHNQTGQRRVCSYLVKMVDVKDASEVRSKFGSFFAGGQDKRPASLSGVSISNWTTPATKVRIAIMKVQAKHYRESNPGSRVQVIGFDSRPTIKITPAPEASDRRVRVFNFIEAIKTLPVNFTAEEKSSIMAKVNPRLYSKIRSLFLVLDDDLEKVNRLPDSRASGAPGRGRPGKRANESGASGPSKNAKV